MPKTRKPGDLLKMFRQGGAARRVAMKASGSIKHTGTFHGKSNVLGHGGRAAQLKARGVPGGVIGNLARAAHAAPGQANYHGHKKSKKKVAAPSTPNLGLALKKAHKTTGTVVHHHVHVHGHKGALHLHMKAANVVHDGKMVDPKPQGTALESKEEGKKEFKKAHKNVSHDGKVVEPKVQGEALEKKEEGKKEFKSAVCKKCKKAHPTSMHGKKKSK